MIHALTRPPADVLAAALAVRPLYADLRPAFAALDPLIALLRRRGFTGLIHVSSEAGVGAVWFDRGRPERGWAQASGAASLVPHSGDPLDLLREFWSDREAAVGVYPGAAIALPAAAPPAEAAPTPPTPVVTSSPASLAGMAPAASTQAPPATGAARPRPMDAPAPPAGSPPAAGIPAAAVERKDHRPPDELRERRRSDELRERRPPEGGAQAGKDAESSRVRAGPPAREPDAPVELMSLAEQVPWDRLLGAAVERVRHHRGVRLARQMEELINEILSPTAIVVREQVQGNVDPQKGYVALRAIAGRLEAVAGSAFTHRVLQHAAHALSCEEAVTSLLALEHNL